MKRRRLFQTIGSISLMSITGCFQPSLGNNQSRLWFVYIHNGSPQKQSIDIRVLRGDELVFKSQYGEIPSFQDINSNQSAPYGTKRNSRLITKGWEADMGVYEVEYKLSNQDTYSIFNPIKDKEIQTDNIAVELHILGGLNQSSVSTNVIEFDSSEEAQQAVNEATREE